MEMCERLTTAKLKLIIAHMKICRYVNKENQVHIGLAKDDNTLIDLTAAEVESITSIMENDTPEKFLSDLTIPLKAFFKDFNI